MYCGRVADNELVFQVLHAAAVVTNRLDRSLPSIMGISFSEYQLPAALASRPEVTGIRGALTESVGLTPSGVTRALKPLEKLGLVETTKDQRDHRSQIHANR